MLLLAPSLAATPVDLETLQATWEATAEQRASTAAFDPPLAEQDLARLAAGHPVVHGSVAGDGKPGTLGAIVVSASPDAIWVLLEDPNHNALSGDEIAMVPLDQAPGPEQISYGTVDLPLPLSDRQFVTRAVSNVPLYTASGGTLWERTILLDDPELAPEPTEGSVWLDRYHGSWLLVAVPGGTLVVYVVGTDIGGNVPPELSGAWTNATLDGVLERIDGEAALQGEHYDAAHAPIQRPDGSVIPPGL